MESVFLKIVNMSLTASWLILAVIALRPLLRRAPKALRCALWALVGVRLLCPFSIESALSLIPSAQPIPETIVTDPNPTINSGLPAVNAVVNPIISESLSPAAGDSVNPLQVWTAIAAVLWLVGIGVLLIYGIVSYLRVKRQVGACLHLRDNVYLCDGLPSPFILGILRPRIYLPTGMDEAATAHILAHEQAHLRRRDHWWKPLGFLLLTVHWFNPLMWVAYILLCRDIELACDERVARTLDEDGKTAYSRTLLACGAHRRVVAACPLAFGEVGVKARVRSVLNYKKPAFWIILAAVIAAVAVAVAFLTNPLATTNDPLKVFVDCQIAEHFEYHKEGEEEQDIARCIDWKLLGRKRHKEGTTLFMWVFYSEYTLENNDIHLSSSAHIPTAITYKKENGHYTLVEYWEPRDGAYLVGDIKEKFPWYLQRKALDTQRYVKDQIAACERLAREHFGLIAPKSPPPDGSYRRESTVCIVDNHYLGSYGIMQRVDWRVDNGILYKSDEGTSDWRRYGTLRPVKLTKDNFDRYMDADLRDEAMQPYWVGAWQQEKNAAAKLRRSTKRAWRCENTEYNELVYLLETYGGDYYAAYGENSGTDVPRNHFCVTQLAAPVRDAAPPATGLYEPGDMLAYLSTVSVEDGVLGDPENRNDWFLDNGMLYTVNSSTNGKISLGQLESFTLTKETFDSFFENSSHFKMVWNADTTAAELRKNTVHAWRYVTTEGHPFYYYLLQLKNGELIACYGMDDTAIRNFLYVYKLTPAEGFCATVLEATKTTLLVEPFEGTAMRRMADKIEVPIGLISFAVPELYEGDQVWILYSGDVQDTYPARLDGLPNGIEIIVGHRDPATINAYPLSVMSTDNTYLKKVFSRDKRDPNSYNVYYYAASGVTVTLDGESVELKDALADGRITTAQLLTQAKKDVNAGVCRRELYDDGGSMEYRYGGYGLLWRFNGLDVVQGGTAEAKYTVYVMPNGVGLTTLEALLRGETTSTTVPTVYTTTAHPTYTGTTQTTTAPRPATRIYTVGDGSTDCPDVGVRIESLTESGDDLKVVMVWENGSGKQLAYGEEFHVYQHAGEGKLDRCGADNHRWNAIAHIVKGERAERTVTLKDFHRLESSQSGDYSVEFQFYLYGEGSTLYNARLDFNWYDIR